MRPPSGCGDEHQVAPDARAQFREELAPLARLVQLSRLADPGTGDTRDRPRVATSTRTTPRRDRGSTEELRLSRDAGAQLSRLGDRSRGSARDRV